MSLKAFKILKVSFMLTKYMYLSDRPCDNYRTRITLTGERGNITFEFFKNLLEDM